MRWGRDVRRVELEDRLILIVARTVQGILNRLPLKASLGFGAFAGFLYSFIAKRGGISYQNLRACLGRERTRRELRGLARKNFQYLFMNVVELLRFSSMDEEYLRRYITVEGLERLDACLEDGKGAIILTGHFGNWELPNIVGGLLRYKLAVFARLQKHPRSDMFLNELRAAQGAQVIYKGITARQIVRVIREGRTVAILVDQDAGMRGVFVPFFGRLSSCPRGIVRFARRTSSRVIPAFDIRLKGGRHRIEFGEEIPVRGDLSDEETEASVMAEFNRQLEVRIRAHPEQWLWPHRRWKSTPNRTCLILSDGKKGHLNQSLAFYEAIVKRRQSFGIDPRFTARHVVEVRYRTRWLKAMLIAMGILTRGRFPLPFFLMKTCLEPASFESLKGFYADYVISCGAAGEPINVILSKENRARACLIHKPQFGTRHYAAVLVPRHDRWRDGDKVFLTDGALVSAESDGEGSLEGDFLDRVGLSGMGDNDREKKIPRIGFLVGGPARRWPWDEEILSRASEEIKKAWSERSFYLFVTSSRRTPPRSEAFLRSFFQSWSPCKLVLLANEKNPEGVYGGLLESSDFFIVTADSVSMISEAFRRGKPVLALWPNTLRAMDRKLGSFLKALEETGRLKVCRVEELCRWIMCCLNGDLAKQDKVDSDAEVMERAAASVLGR